MAHVGHHALCSNSSPEYRLRGFRFDRLRGRNKMSDTYYLKDIAERTRYLENLMKELYWNDYTYTPKEIIELLETHDESFTRHFFSKIVNNATFSTQALLKLFPEQELGTLFEEKNTTRTAFFKKKYDTVQFNITGKGTPGVPAWE